MSIQKYQRGDAVTITIITILVVAVIGLLGFIFWQNFVGSSNSDEETVANQSGSNNEQTELKISEWSVKGIYTKNSQMAVTYDIESGIVTFDTASIPADCKGGGYVGWITRLTGSQSMEWDGPSVSEVYAEIGGDTEALKRVGDHYYVYHGPQSVCRMDEQDPAEVAARYVRDTTGDIMESLVAE